MNGHEKIVESLRKDCNACLIYLFGSTAKDTAHPGSDIDVAFLSPDTISPVTIFDLSSTAGVQVDLIDLSRAPVLKALSRTTS